MGYRWSGEADRVGPSPSTPKADPSASGPGLHRIIPSSSPMFTGPDARERTQSPPRSMAANEKQCLDAITVFIHTNIDNEVLWFRSGPANVVRPWGPDFV